MHKSYACNLETFEKKKSYVYARKKEKSYVYNLLVLPPSKKTCNSNTVSWFNISSLINYR